jgi:Xaa-Pro aminopeptidase
MSRQGIDCLLVYGAPLNWDMKVANARWLTQIGGNGEHVLVVFPLKGEPTVFVWLRTMVPWWLEAQDWIKDVRFQVPSWEASAEGRVRELSLERGVLGVVGLSGLVDPHGCLPYEIYARITARLYQATFVNETSLVEECQNRKSAEEMAFFEKAAAIGDRMLETYVVSARPGVRECEVYARVLQTLIANGGEYPTLFLFGAGPRPYPHPFWFPTQRALEPGDLILAEMHPKYRGYLGHLERTVSLGQPHPAYQRMYEVAMECYQAAMDAMTPGQDLAKIREAMRAPIARAGLAFTECGIKGQGLEARQYPTFLFPPGSASTEFVDPPAKLGSGTLEAETVVGMIIDLVDPKWHEGRTGVVFGDFIAIEGTGPRRLSKFPIEMAVV